MLGCSAIVAIEESTDPNSRLPEDWYPEDEIRLVVRLHPEGDGSTLIVEDPLTEPPPIAPGTYRIVGAWAYMDDLVSPPASGPGYSVIRSTCVDDLVVPDDAVSVEIAVTFALSTDCAIAAVAR